jgi:hypothetical protein
VGSWRSFGGGEIRGAGGPYASPPETGVDPWGSEYVLQEGETARRVEVRSRGPTRIEGDEDDITSTAPAARR